MFKKLTGKLVVLGVLLSSLGFVLTLPSTEVSAYWLCKNCQTDMDGQIRYCEWGSRTRCAPTPPPNADCMIVQWCPPF